MRHAWRRAHRHDGEIIELRRRARPPRPRRLLILVDVSGSLRQHTPDLLRAGAHGAARGAGPHRGLHLRHPAHSDHLRAVAPARRPGAAGGVGAGDGRRRRHGDRGGAAGFLSVPRFVALARGALVIVLSDGLERGDCEPMVRATARLSRLGHRLVWWSPLACSPDLPPGHTRHGRPAPQPRPPRRGPRPAHRPGGGPPPARGPVRPPARGGEALARPTTTGATR